ncbi:hypothetical protein L6452_02359 [Arctium lappa]|uniref:Uncharacterized protein n=1 Tax=Arctium lappa TaxID=4217 RepID=A0ACB9FK07_ARCLA|nr:hypothetical protein L6452_02359 [Arctium lappa]
MREIVEAMKVLAIHNEAQISFGGHGVCLKLVETQNCKPSPTKKIDKGKEIVVDRGEETCEGHRGISSLACSLRRDEISFAIKQSNSIPSFFINHDRYSIRSYCYAFSLNPVFMAYPGVLNSLYAFVVWIASYALVAIIGLFQLSAFIGTSICNR